MYDVLNSVEIPNEIGFFVDLITFEKCFDEKKDFEEFWNKLYTKLIDDLKGYGIDSTLSLEFEVAFTIQLFDGIKYFKFDEMCIINSFYKYFNSNQNNGISGVYLNNSSEQNQEYIKEEVQKLKEFLKEKIHDLSNVQKIDDLKNISMALYNSYMMAYNEVPLPEKYLKSWDIYFHQELQKDIAKFKKIKLWIKDFIKDFSKPLNFSLFEKINVDKFRLYMATQYLIFVPDFAEPNKSILYDSALKIYNSIQDKNIELSDIYLLNMKFSDSMNVHFESTPVDILNKNKFNEMLDTLEKNGLFKKEDNLLEKYSRSDFDNYDVDEIKEFLSCEIDETIAKATSLGTETVNENEIIYEIENLQKEVEKHNLSLDEYKQKKHQLQKLKMVFYEIKPKAIQKGIGAFKNFNVYYYHNGMVALDKIDYGARLFVMPITIYKYIIEHDINSLKKISKIEGVKAFRHDDRIDWLKNAKSAILDGNNYLSEIDLEINEQIVDWDFNFSDSDITKLNSLMNEISNNSEYTDEQKEKAIKKLEKETKRKQELKKQKKQRANKIDKELKNSNPMPKKNMTLSDSYDILDCEEQLTEQFGVDAEFSELYEQVNKTDKVYKRNPAVAKYCKDRTIDANEMYHCEMCRQEYPKEAKSRLDFHHLVPISENGPDTIYNGLCLCTECHRIIHFEKERISNKAMVELLSTIEKHIIEDDPEYLEYFYEYRKKFFPTYNDLIYSERQKIRKELENNISSNNQTNDSIEIEIDKRIKSFEEQLEKEYQMNPQKFDDSFAIDWHKDNAIIRK